MKVACLWFSQPIPMLKLAENCLRLSPQICFRGDEALFIEFGKCKSLYSEEGFLARLKVILRRAGLNPSIAVGQDIPDSLVYAKFQKSSMGVLPLVALLDLVDPFNRDPIARKYVQKMISSFTDLGIHSLADFKKIPRADLVSRFRPIAAFCHQRIGGEAKIPWPLWRPEEIISEKTEFAYFEFYGELEPVLFELKKQLDQIFQRLWARQIRAQVIQLKIYCETNSVNPLPFRKFDFDFLCPQSQTKGALNVIKERLVKEFEKNPIVSPIESLETTVIATAPGAMGQKNFLHNREEAAEQLYSLLNQLIEVHGKEHIFQAELSEDRRPEKSWKKSTTFFNSNNQNISLQGKIPLRPTYLLKPEKIEIHEGCIFIRDKKFKILKWPETCERISGGWMEGESNLKNSFSRDYYQVDLETGTTITIFESAQQYYLHGYFG